MLSSFPLCIKGWLKLLDVNSEEVQSEDWKLSRIIPITNWQSKFCILLENDSKLYIFNDEPNTDELPIPRHMAQCRIDTELNSSNVRDSCYCMDDTSTISSKNQDSDKYASNLSLSRLNGNKQYSRASFFRNGSRFFRRAKSNNKLSSSEQSNKDNHFEMNQSSKSVSNLKRSLSLSRLNRKKSEEKSDSKSDGSKMKNSLMTQSTGDLTLNSSLRSIIRHNLTKETNISEVHASLVGDRPHCFSLSSFAEDLNIGSKFENKSCNSVYTTRYFAASTYLEKQCWMKRLQHTLKPNMENENRMNFSLKLTIYESKYLPAQKRRYYCEVSLDKSLYAKTTTKLSSNDGSVFWAEDLLLNNLPNFKTLTISLFKEVEPGKDLKKKKKKHRNQCIGQVLYNLSTLSSKNELQSWFNLKSPDILPDLSSSNAIQLRVKLRYQSLKVLKNDAYNRLYEIATENYLELIQFLENNLPIKLKEEIATCLVNIHEKNGTIITFLSDLISEEINDLDNSSMTLRANTIVTKIIESHMKLVGFQYLHNVLHPFINDVMFKNVTIEVDPSRFEAVDDHKNKLLLDNQHLLTENLKHIWYKIYDSKTYDFPKQLKSVFIGWRNKLTSNVSSDIDQEKVAAHCDVIVSGCIFLRLLCPAILSPHLFGLVSHFSEKTTVQRTLTLIAKSLQSLANFSKFGEKEHFMTFLNSCFEEEIPRMHNFLRFISSKEIVDDEDDLNAVKKEIHYYGATIDLPVEMARLHSCLMSDGAKDHVSFSPKFQNILKLPDIIHQISLQLLTFSISQSNPSFFSLKKSQVSNVLPLEQRRTSIGPSLNLRIQELGKLDKEISPPRLGSPVCQSSFVDPVSQYALHNDDIWQMRPDANNVTVKTTKLSTNPSIVYSTKPQYNMSPISKSQLNMLSNRRGHYHTHEFDNDPNDLSTPRVNELRAMFSSTNNRENQTKSSIPKYLPSNKTKTPIKLPQVQSKKTSNKVVTDIDQNKVNDSELSKLQIPKKTYTSIIDSCDSDFYKENPLYNYFDISTMQDENSTNSIDRYFTVRSQVNLLEQKRRQNNNDPNTDQNEDFQNLYQELDEIRKQVQNSQLNDLKQLKNILKLSNTGVAGKVYSSLNTSRTMSSNQKCVQKNSVTTDVLDDVINSITIDGAGLEEAQQILRGQVKKSKLTGKQQTTPSTRSKKPSVEDSLRRSSERDLETVPIDISDSQSEITDSSSNKVNSQSSSNCSSLVSGLI